MRHAYAAWGLALLIWAALVGGCQDLAAPGSIPACREQTGILELGYHTGHGEEGIGRNFVIDGRTYCARTSAGSEESEESSPAGPIPQKLMNAIWRAADEIVRSGPFVRDSETEYRWQLGYEGVAEPPALKSDRGILGLTPANVIGICVEGRQPSGEYFVVWPLGREPADPRVRRLFDLIREADRWDTRAKFSPFRAGLAK